MRTVRIAATCLAVLAAAGCSSSTAPADNPVVTFHPPPTKRPAPATSHASPRPVTSTSRPHGPPPAPRGTSPTRRSAPAPLPAVPPGLTVVLNPGHDGGDASHPAQINRLVPSGYGREKACDTTGTNTNAGYPEHAFNWDVAQRVRAILRAHGVHVIMTRPNDFGVGPCVDQRAAIGNRPGVDAVVSIHADGGPADGHGFHVNQDSRRPQGATAAVAHASIELGRAIHAALVRSSGLVPSTYIGTDGYYYRDDLAGLNLATNPATFLELGNMRNAGDAALQSSPAGRARIARAVASGILAFLHHR